MGDTFTSGKQILTDIFEESTKRMMIEKGDKCKSPDELANEFPLQIVDHTKEYNYPIKLIQEAVEAEAYLHIGYFRESESSSAFRDKRLPRPYVFDKPCEVVCMRGEAYAWKINGFHVLRLLEPEGQWVKQEIVDGYPPFLRDSER